MLEFIFTNIDEVIEKLREESVEVIERIKKGMAQGMEYFSGQFIKEQLSGRKRPDYGLNRPTGTLARSWLVRWKGYGVNDFSVTLSTYTKYAAIHQYGGKAGKNKSVTIPKRLYLIEDFQKRGFEFIEKAVSKNLSSLVKGR
jgi:phage gpG-like protein